MKKLLFILPLFALIACGDDAEIVDEEVVDLDSKAKKLSYFLGVGEANGLMQAQFSGDLNKEKVIEGFSSNFNETDPPADCQQSLELLFGPQRTDYNLAYAEEGCLCLGKLMSSQLYRQLDQYEKAKGIDAKALTQGFKDALMGNESTIDKAEQEQIMAEFDAEIKQKMDLQQAEYEAQITERFGENKTIGENFLAMNGKKAGVKTTASGLQYKVLSAGSGAAAKAGDYVSVHYTGTTLDGTKFDSSHDRGEPYSFGMPGQVIAGWNEIILLMPKGAKFEVYIPQELAYGANPRPGGPIEPFMALKFEMEMVNIQTGPQ